MILEVNFALYSFSREQMYFAASISDCIPGNMPNNSTLLGCVWDTQTLLEVFLVGIRKALSLFCKMQVEVYLECHYSRKLPETATGVRKGQ